MVWKNINIKLQILENRPESTGEVKAHLHNGVRACRHKQLVWCIPYIYSPRTFYLNSWSYKFVVGDGQYTRKSNS